MFKFYSRPKARAAFGRLATALLLLLCTQVSTAQISAYNFSQSQGTYAEITDGTILAQPTALTGDGSVDTQKMLLPNDALAFPFTYNGQAVTSIYVYADGFITFGANSIFGNTPISNTTTPIEGAVSAAANDLHALYNINGLTGNISYKTVGTAPNRELVIQWAHFRPYVNSSSTSSYFDWNFQIRLKENNNVAIVYDMKVTGTPTSASVQTGIRGANANQYQTRYSLGTASSNWAMSAAGGSNTSTMTANSTALPPAGFTFQWAYPAACVQPAAQPTNLNLSANGIIVTGTYTASSPPADTYLILRTPAGTQPTVPVNGTVYATGENTTLNARVLYNGPNLTFTDNAFSNIIGNTAYTYTIYAVSSACTGGPIYNVALPLAGNITNCPGPINTLDGANISSNSFAINWTPNNGNALPLTYSIEVSTVQDFATQIAGSPFTAAGDAQTINITGVQPSTKYFFRMKAITSCGQGAISAIKNVTTLCVPTAVLNENFDTTSLSNLPSCWGKIIRGTGTTSSSVGVSTSAGASLPGAVNLYNSGANTNNAGVDVILATPSLINLTAGTHRLRFKARRASATEGNDIQVGTLTDNSASAVFTPFGDATVLTTEYREFVVYFNSYSGTDTMIGFRRKGATLNTNVFIDDITWEAIPSCLSPLNITAVATGPTTATISWAADTHTTAPSSGYEYFVSQSATAPSESETFIPSSALSANLTSLISNTTYYLHIRSICSSTNKSEWRSVSFKTKFAVPAPWTEGFNGLTATPVGWNATGWNIGSNRGATGNPATNIFMNLYSSTASGEFTTVAVGPLPDNTQLSFDYKQTDYNPPYAALENWGNFEVQVSTDFGATWTTIATVNNEAGTGAYIPKSYTLDAYEGMYVSIKIKATRTAGDFDLSFDNFGIKAGVTGVEVATLNNVPAQITTDGGTLQLTATVLPSGVNQNVTWSIVAGSEYATVSAAGLVTATNNGTVTVRAVSSENTSFSDTIDVVITNQVVAVQSIEIAVENDADATISTDNGTLQLTALVLPSNSNQEVTWSITAGSEFATIDANGLVTAINNGTVTVQAVSNENGAITDAIEIIISNQILAVESIAIAVENDAEATISTDNGTLQLTALVLPSNSNQEVTWSIVTGSEFATIDANGLVTAINNGTVTVQAVSNENNAIADTIEIVISNQIVAVESIAIAVENNSEASIITDNGTLQLTALVLPSNSNQEVTWSIVTGSEFATIDANGLVTAINNGTVTVQAVSNENNAITDTIEIVITNQIVAVESITIAVENDAEAAITTLNGTLQLIAQVLPLNSEQEVTWSIVSGDELATVNENGLVTAIGNGTVTVQATSTANAEITDTIEITITGQVLGNDDFSKYSFAVYPNPAETVVMIQSDLEVSNVTVYNLSGQIVSQSSTKMLDVSAFASGTYIAQVQFADGKSAQQNIIKK